MSLHEHIIRPRRGLVAVDFGELWRYRQLLWFLTWRDILVRYKQTAIGLAWAVFRPLLTMAVLTFIFGRVAGLRQEGESYAILTLAAILPWQLFSNALRTSSDAVVNSAHIIAKVYFPRLLIPAGAVLSGLPDFLISIGVLGGLMAYHDLPFRIHLLLLPVFTLFSLLAAFGAGLWLSALNVKYRDVKHVVPFLVQIGLYISPVGFRTGLVPESWRLLYHLNPMAGLIDGFRWAVLGEGYEPMWSGLVLGLAVTVVLLVTGALFFRSTEKTFADVI